MQKKKILAILGVMTILIPILVLASCSAGGGSVYAATWAVPQVNGDSVSIPMDLVSSKHNVHFKLGSGQTATGFVAYTLNGTIQVRARICVPCRGESFTLKGDTLVCDTCGTVFSATTGKGISGAPACQSYTKLAVPFTTANGSITMKMADLQSSFNRTMNRLP